MTRYRLAITRSGRPIASHPGFFLVRIPKDPPDAKTPADGAGAQANYKTSKDLILCGLFGGDAGAVGGTLGIDVAIDKLDDRHRGHVAVAEPGLEDADIPPLT